MKYRCAVGASLAVALAFSCAAAEGDLKSGPQVGQKIPGAFNVLNVNGSQAGKSNCQV